MSDVLKILVDQATEKADQAVRAMAKTQQQLNSAQEKLLMLENYRDECQNLMGGQGQSGLNGIQLRNQLAFAGKITEAITQQCKEIQFLQVTLEQQKKLWQATLAEQRKYQALIDRETARQAKKEAKRDQKMNDEYAARIHRVNLSGELR